MALRRPCADDMKAPGTIVEVLFWLLGGLALFLYGIEMMDAALRRSFGPALRSSIDSLTRSRWRGLFAGLLLTILVQSSSATTVLVVGFIDSGLLTLARSIGIILGANIGTTVTPQLTAWNLDRFAIPVLGVGFALSLAARRKVVRQFGLSCMGFGVLFLGLMVMKFSVSQYGETLQGWLTLHGGPGLQARILAFLFSLAVTSVIQSSAATIAMVQVLALQGAFSGLDLTIPLILGADIGTCATALIASTRASRPARRAALAHLTFNLIGAGITVALYPLYTRLIPLTAEALPQQVANCHTAIKVVNVLLVLPFSAGLAALVTRLLPGEDAISATPAFLDYGAGRGPEQALKSAEKEISRMFTIGLRMLRQSVDAFLNRNERQQESVLKQEQAMDDLYRSVSLYLAEVAAGDVPAALAARPSLLLHIMSDVERIGDHAENIAELAERNAQRRSLFSPDAVEEIRELTARIDAMGTLVLQVLEHGDGRMAEVLRHKQEINELVDRLLDRHEARLRDGRCGPLGGMVYVDLVMNLRRVANHLRHIAVSSEGGTPEHSLQVHRMNRELEEQYADERRRVPGGGGFDAKRGDRPQGVQS